jgi:hypothetical protein
MVCNNYIRTIDVVVSRQEGFPTKTHAQPVKIKEFPIGSAAEMRDKRHAIHASHYDTIQITAIRLRHNAITISCDRDMDATAIYGKSHFILRHCLHQ